MPALHDRFTPQKIKTAVIIVKAAIIAMPFLGYGPLFIVVAAIIVGEIAARRVWS